jgi:hypothetical protein
MKFLRQLHAMAIIVAIFDVLYHVGIGVLFGLALMFILLPFWS